METICVTYGTDGMDVRTDSGDTICTPIENGGGINMAYLELYTQSNAILPYESLPLEIIARRKIDARCYFQHKNII